MNLEKPDQGESYVHQDKTNYCINGMCTTTCLEETKGCAGYKLSVVFGGCMYLSNVTGKCMRPPEKAK